MAIYRYSYSECGKSFDGPNRALQELPPLEPEKGEDDACRGQRETKKQESRGASDSLDHPTEIHAEKSGEERDWQENDRHERESIDLVALTLGNRRCVILQESYAPLVTRV